MSNDVAKVRYTSSNGEIFDLMVDNFRRIKDANFHRYSWQKETIELRYGERVSGWKKSAIEYEATIRFTGSYRAELLNSLHAACEYDILHETPGTLRWNDYTIKCYIPSSDTHPIENDIGSTDNTLIFYCPIPWWTKRTKRTFFDYSEKPVDRMMFDIDNTGRGDGYEVNPSLFDIIKNDPYSYYFKVLGFSESEDGFYYCDGIEETELEEIIKYKKNDSSVSFIRNKTEGGCEAVANIYNPEGKEITISASFFKFEDGIDYNYDYPFDYAKSYVQAIYNDSEYESAFILTIHGPSNYPFIRIGETVVNIFTEIKQGEYLVVDSNEKTITLYTSESEINCFGARNLEYYVFRKIDSGTNLVMFENCELFTLEMLDERSEPKWTT